MNTATSHLTDTVLRAEGFTCPSCVAAIEKRVGRLPGVTSVKVRYATGRIEVSHDTGRASVADLVAAVAKAGYTARPAVY